MQQQRSTQKGGGGGGGGGQRTLTVPQRQQQQTIVKKVKGDSAADAYSREHVITVQDSVLPAPAQKSYSRKIILHFTSGGGLSEEVIQAWSPFLDIVVTGTFKPGESWNKYTLSFKPGISGVFIFGPPDNYPQKSGGARYKSRTGKYIAFMFQIEFYTIHANGAVFKLGSFKKKNCSDTMNFEIPS